MALVVRLVRAGRLVTDLYPGSVDASSSDGPVAGGTPGGGAIGVEPAGEAGGAPGAQSARAGPPSASAAVVGSRRGPRAASDRLAPPVAVVRAPCRRFSSRPMSEAAVMP